MSDWLDAFDKLSAFDCHERQRSKGETYFTDMLLCVGKTGAIVLSIARYQLSLFLAKIITISSPHLQQGLLGWRRGSQPRVYF